MTDAAPGSLGSQLADEARAGSRLALARLLTGVESRSPMGEAALRALYPLAGRAHIVGVTGPPGSGKSTLVTALVAEVRRSGRAVAVLAIDPSSPITGGALLGDRVRMQVHASDPDVFIRSMASRGHLGGLAGTTSEAAAVLDACGFELILIETVGTGQSEVEVAALADTTVVLQVPETGDEIQAIKAGLLEVADIVVVNKSDRPGADRTAAQLRAMLGRGATGEELRILLTSGLEGTGVVELLAALDGHAAADAGQPEAARMVRARAQVEGILAERMHGQLWSPDRETATREVLGAVAAHVLDPYAAADALMTDLDRSIRQK